MRDGNATRRNAARFPPSRASDRAANDLVGDPAIRLIAEDSLVLEPAEMGAEQATARCDVPVPKWTPHAESTFPRHVGNWQYAHGTAAVPHGAPHIPRRVYHIPPIC